MGMLDGYNDIGILINNDSMEDFVKVVLPDEYYAERMASEEPLPSHYILDQDDTDVIINDCSI